MYELDDAFAQILPLVRSTVRTYLENEDDAQDAVQDTLTRLLVSIRRLPDSVTRWKGYAYTTARHTAFDHLRNRRKQLQHRDFSVPSSALGYWNNSDALELAASTHQLDAWETDIYLHRQVRSVMEQMPKLQRDALIMFARGCSYQEIAKAQSTGIGTVRSRLHYARKQARRLLTPYLSA